MQKLTILTLGALLPLCSNAQANDGYAGKWSGTVMLGGGTEASLLVVVTGSTGTYKVLPRGTQGRNNACLGKEYPIQVTSASEVELKFDVKQSAVLTGCPDLSVTLRKSGESSLEGTKSDGMPIKLAR